MPNDRDILHPATVDMLPAFVLAYQSAESVCRASYAHALLSAAYPAMSLSPQDCSFVFGKLDPLAPHLLGANLIAPCLPSKALTPCVSHRKHCHGALRCKAQYLSAAYLSMHAVERVLVEVYECRTCSLQCFGPWIEGVDCRRKRTRTLVLASAPFFFTSKAVAFSARILRQVTSVLLLCSGSFRGIATLLPLPHNVRKRTLEHLLRESWLQFSVAQLLGPAAEHPGLSWQYAQNRMEAWCRSVESAVSHAFRQRWLHQDS